MGDFSCMFGWSYLETNGQFTSSVNNTNNKGNKKGNFFKVTFRSHRRHISIKQDGR